MFSFHLEDRPRADPGLNKRPPSTFESGLSTGEHSVVSPSSHPGLLLRPIPAGRQETDLHHFLCVLNRIQIRILLPRFCSIKVPGV